MNYKKIKDMKIGEIGFCYPWAFGVMPDGSYGVKKSHHFDINGGGSLRLKIARAEHGFILDFSLCPDEIHSRCLYDLSHWEDTYLPVIGVHVPS